MRFIKYVFLSCSLLCFASSAVTAQTSTLAEAVPVEAIEKMAEKTIEIKVKGVGCSRDCKAISFNVAKLMGVSHCKTIKKGATTTFAVTYNPSVATEKAIYAAVENTDGCSKQKEKPYRVKL